MALTEEQKAGFREKIEKYKAVKSETGLRILLHRNEISRLEKELAESMPATPEGRSICERCHIKSMKYMGRTPQGGCSGGDDIYECEICGYSPNSGFDSSDFSFI